MTVLTIRTYGDPCLETVSKPIEEIDGEARRLIADMADTLYDKSHHIGLAAPQVGVNLRLFLMDTEWFSGDDDEDAGERNLQVFINPEIVWESEEDDRSSEGCLSLPGIEGDVYRPLAVKIRYLDPEGKRRERTADGLEARCIQHEFDHLEGVLFVDRMPFVRRRLLGGKLSALKKRRLPA